MTQSFVLMFPRYENDKLKNGQMIAEFSEKSHKSSRDLERQIEENGKLLNEIHDVRDKLNVASMEKDALQKKLTKEVGLVLV